MLGGNVGATLAVALMALDVLGRNVGATLAVALFAVALLAVALLAVALMAMPPPSIENLGSPPATAARPCVSRKCR